MGIRVHRFTAFNTKPGWKGCRDSHIAIMELCRGENMFTVYEDDIQFIGSLQDVALSFVELPDWDMMSLGCSPQGPLTQYSEHLFRLDKTAWCLHAYMMNNNNGLVDFVLENRDKIGKIDKWFSENVYTNPRFNCFLAYPLIVGQIQFQSDTCMRSDVSTIPIQYNKFVTAYAK
jgi:hypothetical protein